MDRNWDNYAHDQQGMECQLVTALNAYHYLTGKSAKFNTLRYNQLIKEIGAKYGAAIDMVPAWRKLGIFPSRNFSDLPSHMDLSLLPMEISVWHKWYGFHSVCAVDYDHRTGCLRIPNFKYVTSSMGWVFREDLAPFVRRSEPFGPPCRQFALMRLPRRKRGNNESKR
jgi:hypothetical protein